MKLAEAIKKANEIAKKEDHLVFHFLNNIHVCSKNQEKASAWFKRVGADEWEMQ